MQAMETPPLVSPLWLEQVEAPARWSNIYMHSLVSSRVSETILRPCLLAWVRGSRVIDPDHTTIPVSLATPRASSRKRYWSRGTPTSLSWTPLSQIRLQQNAFLDDISSLGTGSQETFRDGDGGKGAK
jgi:hypothetical protein